MKVWPFLLFALLPACAHAPNPQAITQIVLSRTSCDPNPRCAFAQYVLYPDGKVTYTSGLHFEYDGRMPLQEYRVLSKQLVFTPGAFGGRSDYSSDAQQATTTIWTNYSGTHRQVRFPTTGLRSSDDPTVNRLNGWARTAVGEAEGAIMRARRKLIARRMRLQDLRRVVFTSNGCYGTCPAYVAEFSSDGLARVRGARFTLGGTAMHPRSLRAAAPFSRITQMLAASGFATFEPEYPFRVEDVYGASFEFDYRDGYSYTVQAPDRTQWPPDVAQLVGSFQQLVRDTEWTPGR